MKAWHSLPAATRQAAFEAVVLATSSRRIFLIVPEGANPSNYVPTDDDFKGALEFLARNAYAAPWMIDWLESN